MSDMNKLIGFETNMFNGPKAVQNTHLIFTKNKVFYPVPLVLEYPKAVKTLAIAIQLEE